METASVHEATSPPTHSAESSGLDLTKIDQARREASQGLNPQRKSELGQFLTPSTVAEFMAGLFAPSADPKRLLDAGAGIGSLTAAFIDRWGTKNLSVVAYEVDAQLAGHYKAPDA